MLIRDCAEELGEGHPVTLLARLRLAEHTEGAGDPAEAVALLTELLPELAAGAGPLDAPQGAEAAELLLRGGYLLARATTALDPVRGLHMWEEIAPELERVRGREDELVVDARLRHALALAEQGLAAQALPLLDGAVRARLDLFGPDDPLALRGRFAYAAGIAAVHGEASARRWWRELLPDATRALGAKHALSLAVRERLGLGAHPEPEPSPAGVSVT